MTTQSAASATSTSPAPAGDKPKGSPPSHRATRVLTDVAGNKAYQDVGAMWPTKKGTGYSLKVKVDIKAGESILIFANTRGN